MVAPRTAAERTRARLDRAIRRRVALVRVLAKPGQYGGVICDGCDSERHPDQMEIDHVDGITWNRYAMSPQMRAARYWREYKAGVRLRALCQTCNARDGARRRWNKYARRQA